MCSIDSLEMRRIVWAENRGNFLISSLPLREVREKSLIKIVDFR